MSEVGSAASPRVVGGTPLHPRDLHVIAHEWLDHEGFYRYVDRRRSTEEVHAMASEYLRLKAENLRLWEAVGCAEAHFDAATDEQEATARQEFYAVVNDLRRSGRVPRFASSPASNPSGRSE